MSNYKKKHMEIVAKMLIQYFILQTKPINIKTIRKEFLGCDNAYIWLGSIFDNGFNYLFNQNILIKEWDGNQKHLETYRLNKTHSEVLKYL